MSNPFSAVWSSLNYLAEQARRLGNAFASLAEQVEQRSLGVSEPERLPAPEAEPVNGTGRRTTKLAGSR